MFSTWPKDIDFMHFKAKKLIQSWFNMGKVVSIGNTMIDNKGGGWYADPENLPKGFPNVGLIFQGMKFDLFETDITIEEGAFGCPCIWHINAKF